MLHNGVIRPTINSCFVHYILTSFLSQSVIEEAISHHSFDDSLELVDTCSYCVALYDYNKVNPNDVQLR